MKINFENILVLDIETVPQEKRFAELNNKWQELWNKKSSKIAPDIEPEDSYQRAGIYAEFGKIVCIGVGVMYYHKNQLALKIKDFSGYDEKTILTEFADFLEEHYSESYHLLAAHNGKEFDFPYLIRRMIILGVKVPKILQLSGKKPWEIQHLDPMELWKQGDYKSYTSLELLAAVFDIQTPKDDIDGSQVAKVFYEDQDLDRIVNYCKKDVVTTAKVLAKICNNENIEKVEIV